MTPGLRASWKSAPAGWTLFIALSLAWLAGSVTVVSAMGPEVPVVTATGDQGNITMVPDGAGGAILAWQDHRTGGSDLYAQHMLSGGSIDLSWPANGALLASNTHFDFVLASTIDGAGGAIVVWEDSTTHVRAQHVRSNGVVDAAWGANGIIVATTATTSKLLNAISDRAGGSFIAWRDNRNSLTTGPDIYVMHLTGTGLDPAWPANGLAVCTAPLAQTAPVLCSDGGTGAIVVWSDRRTMANDYDIYAQHIRINGTVDPAWPVNGAAVVTAINGQRLWSTNNIFYIDSESADNQGEAVIPDGAGGCLIAWTDGNTTASQDIYIHHVLSSGVVDPSWTVGGAVVCNAAGPQGLAYLVSDGSNGAIAVWSDGRNGVGPDGFLSQDIYAQHVLATGAMSGPVNGLPVLTGGTAGFPHMIRDGGNGVTVFWTDKRDSLTMGYDVYAQHVVTSPGLAIDSNWPATGVAISVAADHQELPSALWDGSTGAIVAWSDHRNAATSGWDLYSRTIANVTTGVPLMESHASFALGIAPNPFRHATSVSFDLPRATKVRLDVFDLNGRRVRTIRSGVYSAGRHEMSWDGRSDQGAPVRVGAYLVSLSAEGFRATRRAVVLR